MVRAAEAQPDSEVSPPSDEALLQSGSPRSFEVLTRRHYARVVRFCTRSTGNRALAEDLAQETFIRLWNTRRRYEPKAGFPVFLYTIARNLCRSTHRDEGRRALRSVSLEPEALAHVADEAPLASTRVELRQDSEGLQRALDRLPEAQREALVLRMVEGLDYGEIALVLGRNESTLRSQVFYGLKNLKELLPP